MSDWFHVCEIEERLWAIQEPCQDTTVNCYLLVGDEQAILIDTGRGVANICQIVEQITQLPVMVVNTHAHQSHIGGNDRFNRIAIHLGEADALGQRKGGRGHRPSMQSWEPESGRQPAIRRYSPRRPRTTLLLKDGDALELGGRTLEVVHSPGHSPGSICLWDEAGGLLFTGDTIHHGPIYAQLGHSDLAAFYQSLNRLCKLAPSARLVLPSHGETPLAPSYIRRMAREFKRVLRGGAEYWFDETCWGRIRVYRLDGFSLYTR